MDTTEEIPVAVQDAPPHDVETDDSASGETATTPDVTPLAPLDVRLLEGLGELLAARPRWSQRPPSPAECWDYSTTGDWTASEKSVRRIGHGLCVLIAFAVTYPIEWAIHLARQKPSGFVLGLIVLFVLTKVL